MINIKSILQILEYGSLEDVKLAIGLLEINNIIIPRKLIYPILNWNTSKYHDKDKAYKIFWDTNGYKIYIWLKITELI